MRGVLVVLMLMVLAVGAGLAASRAHANYDPCGSLAVKTVNAVYPAGEGTEPGFEPFKCTEIRDDARAITTCELSRKGDKDQRYIVAMTSGCDRVLHASRLDVRDQVKPAAPAEPTPSWVTE